MIENLIVCFLSIVVSTLVALYALITVFGCTITKKRKIPLLILVGIYLIFTFCFMQVLGYHQLLVNIIFQFVFLVMLCNGKLWKKILLVFIVLFFESLIDGVCSKILNVDHSIDNFEFAFLPIVMFHLGIEVILIILISKFEYSKKHVFVQDENITIYIFYVGLLCLWTFMIIMSLIENDGVSWTATLSTLIIILNIVFSFVYLNKNQQNIRYSQQIQHNEILIDTQKQHIEDMATSYQNLRIFKHDISAYLSTIEQFVLHEQYEELKGFLGDTKIALSSNNIPSYTNIYIASSINQFVPILELNNITFNLDYNIHVHINMTSMEICSLFHNLLKNAIEANEMVTTKKEIQLSLKRYKSSMIINLTNTVEDNFSMEYITSKISSKQNHNDHGIGLLSIDNIVNKYNGSSKYNHIDNTLCTTIVLMNVFEV